MSPQITLDYVANVSAIGAFVVTFVGAGVGISGYCNYKIELRRKTKALESYVRQQKQNAQGDDKGQRSLTHVIRHVV